MPTDTKKWYQSKTIWFNVVTFVLGGFGALNAETMPAWYPETMVAITMIGNIILRALTSKQIKA